MRRRLPFAGEPSFCSPLGFDRRVVVTGVGAVTPLGADMESSWRRLVGGESAGGPITAFPTAGHPVQFACEASEFQPELWMERRTLRRLDRFAQLAVAAARMAESDAAVDVAPEPWRVGASVATAQGGVASLAACCLELASSGRIHPTLVTAFMPNMAAGWISIELGLRGPLGAPCSACAASAMAIGEGYDAIRLDRADVMFCGGSEAGITEVAVAGFAAMRALSRRNDDPARASRPFDADRDGFVMGEGAAILVLEELEHARARSATIYAELVGYGMSSDGFHVSEPDPAGTSQARAIRAALHDAGLEPAHVDYINMHASSTGLGDASETQAVKRAFGEEAASATPVSSIKGSTGHCLGAAGAVEAAAMAMTLSDKALPPTINQTQRDPDCDLDYIPNTAREKKANIAVSTSFGFGGQNAALVMKRFDG